MASVTCSGSTLSQQYNNVLPNCDLSSLDTSKTLYVKYQVDYNPNFSCPSGRSFQILSGTSGNSYFYPTLFSFSGSASAINSITSFSGIYSFPFLIPSGYPLIGRVSATCYNEISSYSLIFTDDISTIVDFPQQECPECEQCQTCPVVPDNPYDDKLDNITQAIYTCGAILLVIYFFYCIYRMLIKNSGGK